MMPKVFIGVDVAAARGCVYAVLNSDGMPVRDGWLKPTSDEEAVAELQGIVNELARDSVVHVGIDSPRMPIPAEREWFWNGSAGSWRSRKDDERGLGRHCEVVIRAHGLANPQWTGTEASSPGWMLRGFTLFARLQRCTLHEVFPSASYRLLDADPGALLTIRLASCYAGPKDVLDAYVAAFTVREFVEKRGEEVGGGDGFGTIILPRRIPEGRRIPGVLTWPSRVRGTA